MALRSYTVLKNDTATVKAFNALALGGETLRQDQLRAYLIQWTGLLNGEFGSWFIPAAYFTDRSVHVLGTFGAAGSVAIEGSNEAAPTENTQANAIGLVDPFASSPGVALAITAAGIKQIGQVVYAIRPHVTAGDGTTSLTVNMLVVAPARGV
jgi:hypothetical protein